tara:strand:- start:3707 stop:4513 length:807 start_codon:yes stop_codon:yes gene_type:complete
MTLLKQSWKTFKRYFYTLSLTQLMLFFSSLFFLVFVKGKMEVYLRKIQEFQPIINQIITTLESTDPSAIIQSQQMMDSMIQVTSQAKFFAFFIVPLVLLFLWIIFQGIFWKTIKKEKITSLKHYLIKLAIPTAIILISSTTYITRKSNIVDFFSTYDINIAKIGTILFLTLYLLTTYYAVLSNQSFTKALKQTFSLTIKKCYKYIPHYLPLFANSLFLMFLLMVTLTQQITQKFFYIEIFPLITAILLSLSFSSYYKIIFQKTVEKDL